MALTLPDVDDLATFTTKPVDDYDEEVADAKIQEAADLLYLATGITEDPDTAVMQRVVGYAIMQMADTLITIAAADPDPTVSSERLGSYSYTLRDAAALGEKTGVPWFDRAVQVLNRGTGSATELLYTTQIFEPSDLQPAVDNDGGKYLLGPDLNQSMYPSWPL